jgi:hypothetical protein
MNSEIIDNSRFPKIAELSPKNIIVGRLLYSYPIRTYVVLMVFTFILATTLVDIIFIVLNAVYSDMSISASVISINNDVKVTGRSPEVVIGARVLISLIFIYVLSRTFYKGYKEYDNCPDILFWDEEALSFRGCFNYNFNRSPDYLKMPIEDRQFRKIQVVYCDSMNLYTINSHKLKISKDISALHVKKLVDFQNNAD